MDDVLDCEDFVFYFYFNGIRESPVMSLDQDNVLLKSDGIYTRNEI